MDRRGFLQAAALGAAGLAGASPVFGAVMANPVDRFATGLARHPWLAGWQDAAMADGQSRVLEVVGRVPEGLAGTLYRNGPGRFSRDGFRYRHWFDGDGLVQGWRIGTEGIRHRARFVGTDKYKREQAAGRFLLPAAGTRVPGALPIRNSDDLNVANTAVFSHGGELYALWEGGSAYALDAETLETRGAKTWREDLASMPFSAHPLPERDGSVWNFGLSGRTLVLWRIGADGAVRTLQTVPLPFAGYLHAFSMTAQHLVFVLLPYVMTDSVAGQAYFEALRWQPERGCRALVVDKDDLSNQRWFALPAGAAYHYGPARQHGRELLLQACWTPGGKASLWPFASEMAGAPQRLAATGTLERIALDLDSGRARMDSLYTGAIDFPSWDERREDGHVFALTGGEASESGYFNAVTALDADGQVIDRYAYGAGCLVEEHRFVAMPGASRARQGWLLGTVLDYRRGRSGLSVLDAENLAAGPVTQAWLPHTLPLGFHGWFAA